MLNWMLVNEEISPRKGWDGFLSRGASRSISDRCEMPGVTRKGLQDLNGQREHGGERGGSEPEKVDMPAESDC